MHIKVFMTLPCLLLQKPSKNSKAKDHTKKREERLRLWKEGNIIDIIQEVRTIQNCFRNSTSKKRTREDSACSFAKLMLEGKINVALKMLSKDYENGVLQVDETVLKDLKLKHPAPAEVIKDSLLYGPMNKIQSCYFDEINEMMIIKDASLTKGSSDLSHVDAGHFRQMLLSKKFKTEGKNLREQIALLSRNLASKFVDPFSIEALTTCRLIPLNKNPRVRPIGIGEVLRRVWVKL